MDGWKIDLCMSQQSLQNNGFHYYRFFQAPAPKKRRLNPAMPWEKYLSDPDNSKCLSMLAAEFLKVCKSLDNVVTSR